MSAYYRAQEQRQLYAVRWSGCVHTGRIRRLGQQSKHGLHREFLNLADNCEASVVDVCLASHWQTAGDAADNLAPSVASELGHQSWQCGGIIPAETCVSQLQHLGRIALGKVDCAGRHVTDTYSKSVMSARTFDTNPTAFRNPGSVAATARPLIVKLPNISPSRNSSAPPLSKKRRCERRFPRSK